MCEDADIDAKNAADRKIIGIFGNCLGNQPISRYNS
jgi:hypothetical protein